MKWRIYRLPGSRETWHIDSGCGSQVFNVRGYKCAADSESVDIGGNHSPRAWIQVVGELHIVDGFALFSFAFPAKEEKKCAVTHCA
jgi:hypothetical protein